jgi:phospholipid/cholesterol/gamma-HCH transport system permease protein
VLSVTIADANRGPRIRVDAASEAARRAADLLRRLLLFPFVYLGDRAALFVRATGALLRRPFRGALLLDQMQFVGVGSLPIVGLVGIFSGGVAAESALEALRLFQQQAAVGGLVGVSLARELAPVFTALMLSARTGAGMASEIGSMRLTEQVDALTSFGVDPVQYLVVPRLIAAMVMTPALTLVFNAVGLLGAYFVAIHLKAVDPGAALHSFSYYTDPIDYVMGLLKAVAFGLAYSLVACYQGLTVRGGARELGRATTSAVVEGAVMILVLDYFLTDLFLDIWPSRAT